MSDINVSLGLDGFDSAVQQFSKLIGITADGEASFITWGKAAAAAGAVLGIAAGATVSFGKDLLKTADDLNKLSQSTGISAEKLSALTYAADLSGVSQEKLGTSIAKLSRNAVSAAEGSGKASEAFDTLGVSVKNTDGSMRGADEILKDVADKFKSMPDGVDKSALSMDLFGKSGGELIPLLNTGSDGIAEMEQAARDLGLTMTNETTVAAENFNDSLQMATDSVKGLFFRGITPLLPALADAAKALSDSARGSNTLALASEGLTFTLKAVFLAAQGVWNIIQTLGQSFAAVAEAAALAARGDFQGAWDALKAGGADVKTNFEDVAKSVDRFFGDTKAAVITNNEAMKADAEEKTNKIGGYHQEAGVSVKNAWKLVKENVEINNQAIADNARAKNNEIAIGMYAYYENEKINNNAAAQIIKDNEAEIIRAKVATFDAIRINDAAIAESAKQTQDEITRGWNEVENAQRLNNEAIARNNDNLKIASGNVFGTMFDSLKDGFNKTVGSDPGQSSWWSDQMKGSFNKASGFAGEAFATITKDFGTAVGDWVVKGKEFNMDESLKNIAAAFISMIAELGLKWAAFKVAVAVGWAVPAPTVIPGVGGADAASGGAAAGGGGGGSASDAGLTDAAALVGNLGIAYYAVTNKDANKTVVETTVPKTDQGGITGDGSSGLGGSGSSFSGLSGGGRHDLHALDLEKYPGLGFGVYHDDPSTSIDDIVAGMSLDSMGNPTWTSNPYIERDNIAKYKDLGFGRFTGEWFNPSDDVLVGLPLNSLGMPTTKGIANPEVQQAPAIGVSSPNVGMPGRSGGGGRFGGGFAVGGQFSVTSPRLFMAGENGSETITVTPHGATQPSGGGGTTIFNGPVILDHVTMKKFARSSFASMRNEGLRYA